MIIGIDPGNKETAIVGIDDQLIPFFHEKMDNEDVKAFLVDQFELFPFAKIGIECIASYGMAVGKEVFETAEWSGRIREICGQRYQFWISTYRVYRRDVKLHLCGNPRAKDSNIRQAIIDRYPATGGGKVPQIGTTKEQGPLFGFSKDRWAALGVALTLAETHDQLTIWK